MSNAVMLDLPCEKDLEKFTVWIAKKWRRLWYWYASYDEAVEMAKSAILDAEACWKPDGGANRRTWAVGAARLAYMTGHHHNKRWKNLSFFGPWKMNLVLDQSDDFTKQMDLQSVMSYLSGAMSPRDWAILTARVHYTLQEVGDMYGLTRERIRQIEERATDKARRAMIGLMAKNQCTDLCELY